jgi:formate dehydrogenase subunit gamma
VASRRIRRFSVTERALHWVHALAFFVLLATGLILYLPTFDFVGNRPLVKGIHLWCAVGWAVAIVLVVVLGDRRGLRRTLREFEMFDRDDRLWLRRVAAPQGRFNAGQKLNAALTAAFALLFAVSGFLLWYGERNTSFRFAGTIVLHDGLMWISLFLLVGHIFLAAIYPRTRHAMRGITTGSVDIDWAREHHRKWVAELEARPPESG